MKTAFVVFNGLTILDFIGPYDALTRLRTMNIMPEFTWEVCSVTDKIHDDKGLVIEPTRIGEALENYDLLVIPGGMATRDLYQDRSFVEWIKSAGSVPLKTSVCTGSLLLGAAGFLAGKRATTHPGAYDHLKGLCKETATDRIVDEGDIVTSGGVTAGIDLGLHLIERFVGRDARVSIARQMDYPYGYRP